MQARARYVLVGLATAAAGLAVCAKAAKHNVLLIAIDDLNANLGAMGDELAHTPHLDKLFGQGLILSNAHSAKSECAPSRASMLAGRRPDALRIWGFEPSFRRFNANLVTLPGLFRANGYRAESVGKLFDLRSFPRPRKRRTRASDLRSPETCSASKAQCSWDTSYPIKALLFGPTPACGNVQVEFFPGAGLKPLERHQKLVHSFDDALLHLSLDYCIASHAIGRLSALADSGEPFFLAVGFSLPHLPWVAPNSAWEPYQDIPDEAFTAALDDNDSRFWRDQSSAWTRYNSKEIESYKGWRSVSAAQRARAYYASVTYVDSQVGRLVSALEAREAVRRDTLVVVWGDHGFHLGDNGLWAKKTQLEQSTRVPLAVIPPPNYLDEHPEARAGVGKSAGCPVDSVDIFPTVAAICGIVPTGALAGVSLVPLLVDPAGAVRGAAVSQYQSHKSRGWIGYSLRTAQHRLIFYVKRHRKATSLSRALAYAPSPRREVQLYKYADPGNIERINLVDDPAHAEALREMLALVDANTDRDWTSLKGTRPFDHVVQ